MKYVISLAIAFLLVQNANAATPLNIGQRVQMVTSPAVHSSASSKKSTTLCTQSSGSSGVIVSGPLSGSGYIWWNVDFDSGCDGWVTQKSIKSEVLSIPSVSMSSNPSSISTGLPSTLTWASVKATSCKGDNFTASSLNGTASVSPTATTVYSITCMGTGGSATAQANVTVTDGGAARNGVCGEANGTTVASQPTSGLCSSGTASGVTGSGPWAWGCAGSNGGSSAQCSAQLASTQLPPPSSGMKLGQFGGTPAHNGEPDTYLAFQQWLGRPIDYTVTFAGQDAGWSDFEGSIGYLLGDLWSGDYNRKLVYSIPLIVKQWDNATQTSQIVSNLHDAAAGMYNDHYLKVATMIRDWREHTSDTFIRVAWEFNGDWYPWASAGKEQDYKGAFRQLVGVFRSVSPGFKFIWNPNIGKMQTDPELSYPGDDVVDFVAVDVYENSQWDKGTPEERWQSFLTREGRGLDWLAAFAKAHNKPIVIPEYSTNYDVPNTVFIKNMHDWMVANGVVMQAYWNSDSAFQGSFATHPANGVQYKQLYGGP